MNGRQNTNLATADLQKGIRLFNTGEYIEAIDILAILSYNGDLLARQYLARCYHRLEKYEIAYKHYEYLANNADGVMRDYGVSMLAAIEIVWRNYSDAIKILRSLPPTKNNLINLSILYWKKYKATGEEFSIRHSLKILQNVKLDEEDIRLKKRVFHLMALIYQAEREYSLAESYYKKALHLADDDIAKARILNDYGSMFIESGNYDQAEIILKRAEKKSQDKSVMQYAFCNKWLGVLYKAVGKFEKAKKHLEIALIGVKEKGLIQDIAEVNFLLAEINEKGDLINFFVAADYYAEGIVHERLLSEVKCDDEKITDFYHSGFYGDNDDGSNIS